jgi:hypothetical protein
LPGHALELACDEEETQKMSKQDYIDLAMKARVAWRRLGSVPAEYEDLNQQLVGELMRYDLDSPQVLAAYARLGEKLHRDGYRP